MAKKKKKSVEIPVRYVSRDGRGDSYEIWTTEPVRDGSQWVTALDDRISTRVTIINSTIFETTFPQFKMPGGKNSCMPFVVLNPREYDIDGVDF